MPRLFIIGQFNIKLIHKLISANENRKQCNKHEKVRFLEFHNKFVFKSFSVTLIN